MAEVSWKTWATSATCPRGLWEEDWGGVGGEQWLDWLRSKMVHCLLVGSLASWGTAMGTSNSLDWKQKLLQKFFTAAIY